MTDPLIEDVKTWKPGTTANAPVDPLVADVAASVARTGSILGYTTVGKLSNAPIHYGTHSEPGTFDITSSEAHRHGKDLEGVAQELRDKGYIVAVRRKGQSKITNDHIHAADPETAPKEAMRLTKQGWAAKGRTSSFTLGDKVPNSLARRMADQQAENERQNAIRERPNPLTEASSREVLLQGILGMTPIPYINALVKGGTGAVTAAKYIPRLVKPLARLGVRAGVGAAEGLAYNVPFGLTDPKSFLESQKAGAPLAMAMGAIGRGVLHPILGGDKPQRPPVSREPIRALPPPREAASVDVGGGVQKINFRPEGAARTPATWENAKPGDVLGDGTKIIARGIKTRAEARRVADQTQGRLSLDGKKWAVTQPGGTPAPDIPSDVRKAWLRVRAGRKFSDSVRGRANRAEFSAVQDAFLDPASAEANLAELIVNKPESGDTMGLANRQHNIKLARHGIATAKGLRNEFLAHVQDGKTPQYWQAYAGRPGFKQDVSRVEQFTANKPPPPPAVKAASPPARPVDPYKATRRTKIAAGMEQAGKNIGEVALAEAQSRGKVYVPPSTEVSSTGGRILHTSSHLKAAGLEPVPGELNYWRVKQEAPAPAPVRPVEAASAKGAWEMTRDEFAQNQVPAIAAKSSPEWQVEVRERAKARDEHRQSVDSVLREGESVPPEVLADYPDLASRYAPAGKVAPEGGGVGAVAKLEADIAARTNEVIPKADPPTPGLSLKLVGNAPRPEPTRPYNSPDPMVEHAFRSTAAGVRKEGFIQHVKAGLANLYHSATRTHELLPRTGEFAVANEGLRYIGHQKSVASNKTLRILQDVTLPLPDPAAFDLFRRKVVLDDFAASAAKGEPLPFGLTADQVTGELGRVDSAIANSPEIARSLTRRKNAWAAIKSDYIAAMKDMGFNVEDRLTREDYFRHQVLDYMESKGIAGTGGKVKTPTGRGFLKAREGSTKAISTNYLQAEWEVMSQMLHDAEVAKTLKKIEGEYDISAKVRADAKAQELTDWHQAIPEGHTVYQPREGNLFYRAKSVPEAAVDGVLDGIGIDPAQLRDVLAIGGKRKEWVIPEALAKTLDGMNPTTPARSKLNARLLNLWKQYVLLNPRRMIKYNLRNLSGDAEMAFVGNPSTFKEVIPATRELHQIYRTTRAPEGDLADWIQRGGQQGLLQAQEMGNVDQLGTFLRLADKTSSLGERAVGPIKKYWTHARLATDFREGILRYAAYKDYLRQITESPKGEPKNWGASIREEVMALKNPKDRAYKLSNELLGAYDQISELGKGLRSQAYPFWSWVEVNFGRNIRLMRNAVAEGQGAGVAARSAALLPLKVARTAYSGAKLVAKASFLWTALQTYNNLRFPNEEKDLPPDVRAKPHLIFGRSKDGTVNYIGRLGAVADFLEWFGADVPQQAVSDYLNGRRSVTDIAVDMVKTPVNKATQGLNPLWKMGTELATGKTLYPDVFKPGNLRDPADYVARQFSLENEFRVLTGRPHEPYLKSAAKGLADQINPDQTAYYEILDRKYQFLDDMGKPGGESGGSPKSAALYSYKRAKALGDKQAEQKYLAQYKTLGGTDQGLAQSVRTADPYFGLGTNKRKFLDTLTAEEKRKLPLAIRYYKKIATGVSVGRSTRSTRSERSNAR